MLIFTIDDIVTLIIIGLLFALWLGTILFLFIQSAIERTKDKLNGLIESEEQNDRSIKVEDCGENIGNYNVPIYKAILIPKNATNGDVIKELFGCGELACDCDTDYESVIAYGLDKTPTCEGTLFTAKWWNAPYKAESEG